MTRWKSVLAAAALLPLIGFGPAQAETFDEAALYEKAREESELTWYIGQYGTELAEKLGTAFTAQYPGVKVNVIRAGGQVIYSRLQQDLQAGVAQCDVFGATEIGHLVAMKEAGQLQTFQTANDDDLYPAFRQSDPDGYFVTTQNSNAVLIYNTNLVSENEAPKAWADLTDERWKDKLSFGHPGFSGSAASWTALMIENFGEEYIETLGELNPHIGRSFSDPAITLASGERAVGVTTLSWAINGVRSGNPIGWVIPAEGAMEITQASGIPVNAPHPNAARLFINYIQSPEASTIVADNFGWTPINAKAPVSADTPAFDQMAIASPSILELADKTEEAILTWRDVFGN